MVRKVDWRCETDAIIMDEHDIGGARAIVRGLCRDGIEWHRRSKTTVWESTFQSVGMSMYHDVQTVEGLFLNGGEGRGGMEGEINGPYILLQPPPENPDIVCLLGIHWRLTEDETQMSLYLNMFGAIQDEDRGAWHRGYRLELAHGAGVHDYSHVQPIRATGRARRAPVRFADQSVPDSFPAFPLPGRRLTTLCAAFAVALHGAHQLATVVLWLRGHRYQDDVRNLLTCCP